MSFAEEAEKKLIQIMIHNRDSAFSKFEKSHQGENIVVKFLERRNEPTSPKFLAESLNLSSARIAALLGTLEKKGQIVRTIDSNDRRRIKVTLTDEGKKFAEIGKREMRDKIIQVFEQMGEEDTELFIQLIEKFADCSKKISQNREGDE